MATASDLAASVAGPCCHFEFQDLIGCAFVVEDESGDVLWSAAAGSPQEPVHLLIWLTTFIWYLQLLFPVVHCRYRAHYIVLDEIFDSLDEAGQQAVITWVRSLPKRLSKVC